MHSELCVIMLFKQKHCIVRRPTAIIKTKRGSERHHFSTTPPCFNFFFLLLSFYPSSTSASGSKYGRQIIEDLTYTQIPPKILGPLKGTNKIVEGQNAHFETRVEPQNDPGLKIEWLFNGKPVTAANRTQTYSDFGYVAIDILCVRPEDSGTYTVVARNALGEAQQSAMMTVQGNVPKTDHTIHILESCFFFSFFF
jgi:hypothetical protein